jgi:arabinofuranosyltransferase
MKRSVQWSSDLASKHPLEVFVSWVLCRQRLIIAGLGGLLVLYAAAVIFNFGVTTIDGVTYFLVHDDIMISMRYARNLAQGAGLVYNAGEHVEGFTNPLLTLVAAGLHLLPVSLPMLPLLLMLINLGLSLSIVYMLTRFWGDAPQGRLAGLLGAMLYVGLSNHAYHAYAGFEVYMFMVLLLLTIWRFDRLGLGGALMLGLLPLTHATALVAWAILVVAIFFVTDVSPRKRFLLAAVAVLPFCGYELFRIIYYHDFLPNTAWLKVGGGSFKGGLLYVQGWLSGVKILALLALYTLVTRTDRKTILLGVLLASHTAAVVALGGDIFLEYRFLFPCSLILAALAGHSVSVLLTRAVALSRAESTYLCILLASAMAYATIWVPFTQYRWNIPELEANKGWNIASLSKGIALSENTAPTATVALFGLGYTGYYSERYVIDMLGKADRHIAHAKPTPNRLIGHNKTDFDYVLRLSPDYIDLGIPPCKFADRAYLERRSKVDIGGGYMADLALHPIFRKMYAPIYDREGHFTNFYAKQGSEKLVWNISASAPEPEGTCPP